MNQNGIIILSSTKNNFIIPTLENTTPRYALIANAQEKNMQILCVLPNNAVMETYLYQLKAGFAKHNNLLIYFAAKPIFETAKAVYLFGHGTTETTKMGICCKCGRVLTHPVSVELGIGPECGKHFHDWDLIGGYNKENLERLKGALVDIKFDSWVPKSQIVKTFESTEQVIVPADHPILKRKEDFASHVEQTQQMKGETDMNHPVIEDEKPNGKTATMAQNSFGDRVIRIRFPYDLTELEHVRSLSGRKYHPEDKCWSAPIHTETLASLIKWGYELDGRLKTFLEKVEKKTETIAINGISGLKGTLRPFQNVGVGFIESKNGRALVADEQGLGKAQPLTSNVLTPSGWKKIGNLQKGDELFGPDGKIHYIKGIFPQGEKDIYKVTFSDRTSCECCEDHLWAVNTPYERWKKKPYKVLSLKSIVKIGILDKFESAKWAIPITKPIEFETKELPLKSYLLGALLGDGSLSQSCVNFTNADQDIINKVSRLLPEQNCLTKIKSNYNYRAKGINSDGNFDYRIINKSGHSTNFVRKTIQDYKLNVTSEYKFIPNDYKFSSVKQRIALLHGLMDTDGYTSHKSNVTQFTSTSEHLCDDVTFLIQSLGGITYKNSKIPTYIYKGEHKVGKIAYTITIKLPKGINPFSCKRKKELFKERVKYFPCRWIKDVTFIGKKQAICISTSQPNKLYLTNNCVVTHNTMEALAYLQLHRDKIPVIIVVPASLKLNWKKEAEAWLPNPKVEVLSGTTPWRTRGDILIINYDILPDWVDTLKKKNPQVLILDEVHYTKSSKAQRTKAVKKLGKGIPHIIGLSGTPIVNRPIEAFNAISLINPDLFPNFFSFTRTYCNARHNGFGWDFNGASHTKELHEILTNSIMIRRLKKDVLTELPDKVYSFVPIELNNNKEYKDAESNFIRFVRQTKGDVAAERASNAEALAAIEGLKQLAVKGKLPDAISWIKNFLEVDGKLVVFATHKFVIEALMNEFKGIAVKLDGMTNQVDRQRSIDIFQHNPEVKLFIGNIQAAGIGITLTAASNVAFLEYPWTSGALIQATDRVHRIGQKECVNVHYLIAINTIEERIIKLLNEKAKVLEQVLDGVAGETSSMLQDLLKEFEK